MYYSILIIIILIIFICVYNLYVCIQKKSGTDDDFLFAMQFAAPTNIYPPLEKLKSNLKFKRPEPIFDCAKINVPNPVKDLPLLDIYDRNPDGTVSTTRNVQNEQTNDRLLTPVTIFQNTISDLVIELVKSSDTETKKIQDCMLNTLYKWAEAGALTGNMGRGQGYVDRMFFIVIVTFGFLKIKQFYLNDSKTKVIENWLKNMDIGTWNNFKDRTTNLKSWAVLAHFLVSIAIGDEKMYNNSVDEFVKQVNFIENDGTIKTELERKNRASTYIVFYADPLLTMQYILKFIGNQKYNQPKINNLVNLILDMKRDKDILQKKKLVAEAQLPITHELQCLILYENMFNNQFISADNKNLFNSQVKLYQKNISEKSFAKGNLYSLFGV